MKVAICSKYDKKRITIPLKNKGFVVVRKNPDIVISYGGDGTILYSENKYPNIPKLIIKINSKKFREYDYGLKDLENKLEKIKKGEYSLVEEMKIKAKYKGKTLEEAQKLTKDDIIKELGGELPQPKIHCSLLGIEALKKAIEDYKKKS